MADDEKKPSENTEKDPENATESDEKVNDAKRKDATKKDAAKAKEKQEEEGEDESSEEEEQFGLYDKPLVLEGKRERKRTDFLVKDQPEIKKPQPLVFNGKGETLGSMEVVNHELSRCTGQELKPLHKLLFGRDGRSMEIKKNIRAFNGFNFEEGTKEYENKKFMVERFTNEGLKRLLEILDLEKKGTREDLKERVFTFLMKPKGSGRTVQPAKKKAKKSKPKSRGKGEKRKRTPKKEKKSSEEVKDDDEDEDEEEESEEEEPKKKKAKTESKVTKSKGSPKKITSPTKTTKESKKSDKKEKEKSEKKESTKKESKKETKKDSKKTKSKPVTVKITAGKRSPKKSPKKVEKPVDDDESSSDDEPLSKKIKKQPPSNEELASVVREILKDADLDHDSVKSIGKQVFSKYPEFDLSDRRAFIKETVYSIISGDAD